MKSGSRAVSWRLLGGVLLLAGLAVALLGGAPVLRAAETRPADTLSIKGTCTFGKTTSTWSAKLTPKGDGTYDAAYVAIWGGKPVEYAGTLKSDFKTEISGSGKGKNGNFEFKGKYGDDGVAKCNYKEIGDRGRKGSLTAEMPE